MSGSINTTAPAPATPIAQPTPDVGAPSTNGMPMSEEQANFENVMRQAAVNFTQIGDAAGIGLNSLLSKAMDGFSWAGPDDDPAANGLENGEEDIQ